MDEIDVVITWVDGADPALAVKRDHYMTNAASPLHGNGINPHRWVCSDELNFCLRSIANNAPWVRAVWIITDGQIPDIAGLPQEFTCKIKVIDHRIIFGGFADLLPTFNSLSIETMMWRIPGLAEHFLYFNDDVFLTAPVQPHDFFTDNGSVNGPMLRGKWTDYAHLPSCDNSRDDASLLNHYAQINAALMMGYDASHIFASAHTVHPMQRSVMSALFAKFHDEFAANAGYRFRCTQQFLPQSLYNHACLRDGTACLQTQRDYLHVAVGAFDTWTTDAVHDYLRSAERHDIKFLCVNDLPDVERNFPEARNWILAAIGGGH